MIPSFIYLFQVFGEHVACLMATMNMEVPSSSEMEEDVDAHGSSDL